MQEEALAARWVEAAVDWLRQRAGEAGARGFILGLSGGIDSAVVAALVMRALPEHSLGLILPCHSLKQDVEDAKRVAESLAMPWRIIDLSAVHDQLLGALAASEDGAAYPEAALRLASANLKPRLRMAALYYIASLRGLLVLGTTNRSEYQIGYFTKYGDGGADLLPLARLLKREVYAVAEHLNLPRAIIERPPSAGLWEGQTDEAEMGFGYDVLDRFLSGESVAADLAATIAGMMRGSEHKRALPPQGPPWPA